MLELNENGFKIKKIAEDCGTYIAKHNSKVTAKEISFLIEKIVENICMEFSISLVDMKKKGYLKDDNFKECYDQVYSAYSKLCGGYHEPKSERDRIASEFLHDVLIKMQGI